jgi:hypothetical protein
MQSNHMERMHMWSSFNILIEDLRLSSNVAVTVTKNRKLLSEKIFKNPVKIQLPPNFMEMMHIWSTFRLMVANPSRFNSNNTAPSIGTIAGWGLELSLQGSPNQAKWATSSSWFQWSRPISVKKRSFSRPVSLFKSVFFHQ